MNTVSVIKSLGATAEDLEKINAFSCRELTAEEVYVFKMILCDNEVDRDFEYFTKDALNTLSTMFLGKTGIFDHNPKADNQSARIFETQVITENGKKTSLGDDYTYLFAKAYIFKNERTKPLIDEIDAGIKKEISVGCSVGSKICSVCGEELGECEHKRGKIYNGVRCVAALEKPLDAYEFSFVAVPAQKGARVIKEFSLKSLSEQTDEITLTKSQVLLLKDELKRLEKQAKRAEGYENELKREVMAQFCIALPNVSRKLVSQMLNSLDGASLSQLKKEFSHFSGTSQLINKHAHDGDDNGEFLI
jgi:hypothetical protein